MENNIGDMSRYTTSVVGPQWDWQVISFNSDNLNPVIHGRLTVPGLGSRDAVQTGSTLEEAIINTMREASTMFIAEEKQSTPNTVQPRMVLTEKQIPVTHTEKATELKVAYGIKSKADFVRFAQVWDSTIETFDEIHAEAIHDLHRFVDENPKLFELFVKSIS